METVFMKGGSLELVWLAGNGQFVNNLKGRKSKYYRQLQGVNISDLCQEVKTLSTVKDFGEDIGLKQRGVMVLGLAALDDMKIDLLIKNLEGLLSKLTTVGRIDIDYDAGLGGHVPARRRRAIDVNPGDLDLSTRCGEFCLPDSFCLDIRKGADLPTPDTTGAVVEEIEEDEDEGHQQRQRQPRGRQGKSRAPAKSGLLSQEEIVRRLKEARLDPRANLIIDVDLPPPPPMDDDEMRFEDIDPMALDLGIPEAVPPAPVASGSSNAEGLEDGQILGMGLMSPPRDFNAPSLSWNIRRPSRTAGAEGDQLNSTSFELEAIDASVTSLPSRSPSRKARRRIVFDDENNKAISNHEMLAQIRSSTMTDDQVANIQYDRKGLMIKIGMELFERTGNRPTAEGKETISLRLTQGMKFIEGTGRRVPGLELQDMLKNIRHLPLVPRDETGEEPRGGLDPEDADVSGRRSTLRRRVRVPESLINQQEQELPVVLSPPMPMPMDDIFMEPVIPDMAGEGNGDPSQSPGITQKRQTFKELFPPETMSKEAAAKAFVHLLTLQKEKRVLLEQEKAFGPIYVTYLPTPPQGRNQ